MCVCVDGGWGLRGTRVCRTCRRAHSCAGSPGRLSAHRALAGPHRGTSRYRAGSLSRGRWSAPSCRGCTGTRWESPCRYEMLSVRGAEGRRDRERERERDREREGERARGRKQTCGLQSRGAPRCGSPPRTQRGSNRRCRAWRRWLRQRERSWRRPVLTDRQGGAEADREGESGRGRQRARARESESARESTRTSLGAV